MFQLIEKNGERKAVYSKGDLEYMLRRGWAPVVQKVAAVLKPPVQAEERTKRKYTKRAA